MRILMTLPESLGAEFERLIALEHSTASACARRILAMAVPRLLAQYEAAATRGMVKKQR